MAALPTICLSALRALISGVSLDSPDAPSSVSTSAEPSLGVSPPCTTSLASSSSSSRIDNEHLYNKDADEKSREDEYIERDYEFAGLQRFGRASLVALAAASLCYSASDPALALQGGDRYRQEVTFGQDLTGRNLCGSTRTSTFRQGKSQGGKLLSTSFFESDLTGTDLVDANFRVADFSLAGVAKSNLTNSNLEGSLMTENTWFKSTAITGAEFTEAD